MQSNQEKLNQNWRITAIDFSDVKYHPFYISCWWVNVPLIFQKWGLDELTVWAQILQLWAVTMNTKKGLRWSLLITKLFEFLSLAKIRKSKGKKVHALKVGLESNGPQKTVSLIGPSILESFVYR